VIIEREEQKSRGEKHRDAFERVGGVLHIGTREGMVLIITSMFLGHRKTGKRSKVFLSSKHVPKVVECAESDSRAT